MMCSLLTSTSDWGLHCPHHSQKIWTQQPARVDGNISSVCLLALSPFPAVWRDIICNDVNNKGDTEFPKWFRKLFGIALKNRVLPAMKPKAQKGRYWKPLSISRGCHEEGDLIDSMRFCRRVSHSDSAIISFCMLLPQRWYWYGYR